jgi:hypothetical protein
MARPRGTDVPHYKRSSDFACTVDGALRQRRGLAGDDEVDDPLDAGDGVGSGFSAPSGRGRGGAAGQRHDAVFDLDDDAGGDGRAEQVEPAANLPADGFIVGRFLPSFGSGDTFAERAKGRIAFGGRGFGFRFGLRRQRAGGEQGQEKQKAELFHGLVLVGARDRT